MTLSIKTHGITTPYIECQYDEFHNAECRILFIVILNVIMLSVVMLNGNTLSVFMLNVVAPF
jgi:hypothetical protein